MRVGGDQLAGRGARVRVVVAATLLFAGLDQATKLLAVIHLTPVGARAIREERSTLVAAWSSRAPCSGASSATCPQLRVWGPLSWRYLENYGAAWASQSPSAVRRALLIVFGLAAGLSLTAWALRARTDGTRLAAAMTAAGVLGNLSDRLRLGYVIDFASVQVGGWRFPVFNLADAMLTLGAILLTGGWILALRTHPIVAESASDGYGGRRG